MIKQYKLAEIAVQDILNRDIREDHDVEAVVDEIMAKRPCWNMSSVLIKPSLRLCR